MYICYIYIQQIYIHIYIYTQHIYIYNIYIYIYNVYCKGGHFYMFYGFVMVPSLDRYLFNGH